MGVGTEPVPRGIQPEVSGEEIRETDSFSFLRKNEGLEVELDVSKFRVKDDISSYQTEVINFRSGQKGWLVKVGGEAEEKYGMIIDIGSDAGATISFYAEDEEGRKDYLIGQGWLRGIPINRLLPGEIGLLDRKNVLSLSKSISNQDIAGELKEKYKEAVEVWENSGVEKKEAERRSMEILAHAKQREKFEEKIAPLRKLVEQIYQRKESYEGLSWDEELTLSEGRRHEKKIREALGLGTQGDIEWYLASDIWFWDDGTVPVGVVRDLGEGTLGENQMLGAVFVVEEDANPIAIFEQNLITLKGKIEKGEILTQKVLDQKGWLSESLGDEGDINLARKRIYGACLRRVTRERIDLLHELGRRVALHEIYHEYCRSRGDEPDMKPEGYNQTYVLTHEVSAYLAELTAQDISVAILSRLGSRIGSIKEVKSKGGNFWGNVTKGVESSTAGLIAVEVVLREFGWDFDTGSWERLEEIVTELIDSSGEKLNDITRKLVKLVKAYETYSSDQKQEWLTDRVGFDLTSYYTKKKPAQG